MSNVKEAYVSDLKWIREIIESPPLGVHGFIRGVKDHFCFLTVDNIKSKLQLLAQESENINYQANPKASIPKIMHRVWLNPGKSVLPEEKFLATIRATCKNLGPTWQHIIWVNNSKTKLILEKYYQPFDNIKILDYRTDFIPLKLKHNIEKLIENGKLAFACDQLRLELIYHFGGVYGDIGFHFKMNISELILNREYAFLMGQGLFFQNSFFGARAKDPLFRTLLEVNSQPDLFPREMLDKVDSFTEGYLASGLMVTFFYLLTVPDNIKPILFCGNKEIIQLG